MKPRWLPLLISYAKVHFQRPQESYWVLEAKILLLLMFVGVGWECPSVLSHPS